MRKGDITPQIRLRGYQINWSDKWDVYEPNTPLWGWAIYTKS